MRCISSSRTIECCALRSAVDRSHGPKQQLNLYSIGKQTQAHKQLQCLTKVARRSSPGGRLTSSQFTILGTAQTPKKPSATPSERTEQILRQIESNYLDRGAGGAGSGATLQALQRADEAWSQLRDPSSSASIPKVVQVQETALNIVPEFDVVVCGGTLGIFLAAALQKRGLKVSVVERGKVTGRDQDWNISRKELEELIDNGVLTKSQVEEAISIEFNPCRCGFDGGDDIYVDDILNLGVSPKLIIESAKAEFEAAGGVVLEQTALKGITVHSDAAEVNVFAASNADPKTITTNLVLDCMGNFSPVVKQIREGQTPDGVCLVVGTCARGYRTEDNTSSDVIYTERPISDYQQIFWEAFPAGSGPNDRTTYMFTYIDANQDRPSLASFLETYWDILPEYQNVKLEDLEFLRCLFGFFPTYRDSPLVPPFPRVLQVGDASGIQSPLSFGGFGALSRHLGRLSDAVTEAVEAEALDATSLGYINAYSPGLSSAWLFQKAMSVPVGGRPAPSLINEILGSNFEVMDKLGGKVLRPFLQDVVQFGPLAQAMAGMTVTRPLLVPRIIASTGVLPVLDWTRHFIALGMYDVLFKISNPLKPLVEKIPDKSERFYWKRLLEAWEYGSGNDYK